ncbi:glycoside hydrolase family 43 protein [Microbulbifer sp. CAU 1566]|uniref:glycoside hydrolase family 43 protein n=1 Tax=Microbulbifer sp. CAU 1566 TaxID=2933269 RepID=UPI002003D6FA|nr:glycoside hydrolase family 43 protein [Microbulbifer sp. CAU 1566]MCK7596314.1 glycoside hydrolase family 43 protein [Microbulbifer sp. CAU 1566]
MKNRFLAALVTAGLTATAVSSHAANPAITEVLTADPAAMVYKDTVYLYTGHDEAKDNKGFYEMHKWLVFSSKDMVNWKNEGSPLTVTDFKWAKGDAWASHVVEKDGKFYFYTTVRHDETKPGFAVGVAVSDSPTGPFKDALGKALISNDMTTDTEIDWDDLDPATFIDDNGEAYLFWGNTKPRWAKLKDNMIQLDGPMHSLDLPNFTEALYAHKHGDNYYLTYAMGFPEKIGYAMSKSIEGPWEYKGVLNELAGNSNTNHQSIIDFKGRSFFIYHNGGTPEGGSFRRSVCIDDLHYNEDGTIQRVVMTSEGVKPVQ